MTRCSRTIGTTRSSAIASTCRMATTTPTQLPPQTATATPTPLATPTPTSVPVPPGSLSRRIDAGGTSSYMDSRGNLWSADQPYLPGGFGYTGSTSTTWTSTAAI